MKIIFVIAALLIVFGTANAETTISLTADPAAATNEKVPAEATQTSPVAEQPAAPEAPPAQPAPTQPSAETVVVEPAQEETAEPAENPGEKAAREAKEFKTMKEIGLQRLRKLIPCIEEAKNKEQFQACQSMFGRPSIK